MADFPADHLDGAFKLADHLRGTMKVLEMAIACESGGLDPEQRRGLGARPPSGGRPRPYRAPAGADVSPAPLCLGDPAQLPPVSGTGFFTEAEPDVMLTEVHRQAAENPIIRMATTVREGGRLRPGIYGSSEVVAPGVQIDADRVLAADQVLVGTNRTRRSSNARFRELHGRNSPLPVPGDWLVCLRNDRAKRLLNGGLWQADKVEYRGAKVRMGISSEDIEGAQAKVSVPIEFFTGHETRLDPRVLRKVDQFDYGYALTVHKAQGSQWNDVVLFDESACFREHRARHLYTAITRAAETVTVVQ